MQSQNSTTGLLAHIAHKQCQISQGKYMANQPDVSCSYICTLTEEDVTLEEIVSSVRHSDVTRHIRLIDCTFTMPI